MKYKLNSYQLFFTDLICELQRLRFTLSTVRIDGPGLLESGLSSRLVLELGTYYCHSSSIGSGDGFGD